MLGTLLACCVLAGGVLGGVHWWRSRRGERSYFELQTTQHFAQLDEGAHLMAP